MSLTKQGKKRFLNKVFQDGTMREKEGVVRPSGLSVLKPEEMIEYEGQCLGIVDGRIKFHGKDANEIVKALIAEKSSDKVFTSIPRSNIALVK